VLVPLFKNILVNVSLEIFNPDVISFMLSRCDQDHVRCDSEQSVRTVKIMEDNDFESYNKCLFRTISYFELKHELEMRNINFSPSDSYYILTLKLRREILRKTDPKCIIGMKIDEEITAYKSNLHSVGNRYKCSLVGCSFLCKNHAKYMSHLEFVHQNSTSRFTCNYGHNCPRTFQTFKLLKSHVANYHVKHRSSVVVRQNMLVEQLLQVKCLQVSCGHEIVSTISKLKLHLYSHTDRKEEVKCIFCPYKSDTTGTLKSHFCRKHKVQTIDQLQLQDQHHRQVLHDPPLLMENTAEAGIEETVFEAAHENGDGIEEESEIGEDDCENDEDEIFMKALAITVIELVL
jgi:hypothetical protein